MCRGKEHGGRRCPGDTSQARTMRARNARARKQYEGAQSDIPLATRPKPQKTKPTNESPQEKAQRLTREIRADLARLRDGGAFDGDGAHEACIDVGGKLHELAVSLNGGKEFEGDSNRDEVVRLKQTLTAIAPKLTRGVPAESTDYTTWFVQMGSDMQKAFDEAGVKRTDTRKEVVKKLREYCKKEHDDAYGRRAEKYREALMAVGVEMGGKISGEVTEKISQAKALRALNDSLENVPSSWVRASNGSDRLRVASTRARAHYGTKYVEYVDDKSTTLDLFATSYDQGMYDSYVRSDFQRAQYIKVTSESVNEDGTFLDPKTGITFDVRENMHKIPKNGSPVYFYSGLAVDHWMPAEAKPPRGWVRVKNDNGDNSDYIAQPAKTGLFANEITISGEGEEARRVALHEFTHRAEDTHPILTTLEKKFLDYRVQASGATIGRVGFSTKEVGYADSFFEPYAGRIYDGDSFEVMSMGMETLFHGRNGGFVGQGRDDEYRNFVLGALLATSE